jgi:hypothetical protein
MRAKLRKEVIVPLHKRTGSSAILGLLLVAQAPLVLAAYLYHALH